MLCSKYIQQYDWAQFKEAKFSDDLWTNLNFRIVKIVNFPIKVNDLIDVLYNEKVKNLLTNSSHFFFLVIESAIDLDLRKFVDVVFNIFANSNKKQFLFEFCSRNVVRFIVNEGKVERLSNDKIFQKDDENRQSEILIRSLIKQNVSQSLLEYNLPLPVYQHIFNDDSYQMDAIGIRLLKTFDYDEEVVEEFHKNVLKKFVVASSVPVIRAYLNLPIVDDGGLIRPTKLTQNAISYRYDFDQTLLFLAASKDLNVLKLVLRLGADVQEEDTDTKTATDYTYGILENLKFLLENDARFPREPINYFDYTEGRDILTLCKEREDFHNAIEAGDVQKIQKFRKEFPSLKFAYKLIDDSSQSKAATTTAILKASIDSDYKTYFLLLDEGFCSNDHELAEQKMEKVTGTESNLLWISKLQRKQSHSQIIRFLLSMTKVAHPGGDEYEKYFERIKLIYKRLNGMEEVKELLKILGHSKSFTINFDFVGLDFKPDVCCNDKIYHHPHYIYISGSNKTDQEIASILVHHLTHFAIQIIFNNACKPYYKNDEIGRDKFDKIVEEIKNMRNGNHPEIQQVFECCTANNFASELIVRVPQLIALNEKNILQEKYTKLFDYFHNSVLQKVKELTQDPEEFFIKQEVEQLNKVLGNIDEIEMWNIQTSQSIGTSDINDGINAKIKLCKSLRLFLADVYSHTVESDNRKNHFIVASLQDFNSSSKIDYIIRIWNLTPYMTLLLNCEVFDESLVKKWEFVRNENIFGKFILFASEEFIIQSLPRARVELRSSPSENDLNILMDNLISGKPYVIQASEIGLQTLLKQNVTTLSLSFCDNITSESWSALIENGSNMKELELTRSKSKPFSSHNFDFQLSLPNLKRLKMQSIMLPKSLQFSHLLELNHLDLSQCTVAGSTLNSIVNLPNLTTLILFNIRTNELNLYPLCAMKQLTTLDISTASYIVNSDGHSENPDMFLATLIENLTLLTHLDISGTNLAGADASILGLVSRSSNPLQFLGLYNTKHSACRRSNIPAITIAGEANEEQILTSAVVYQDRPIMLTKVLNDLHHVIRFETCKSMQRVLDVVLRAMNRHLRTKHMQIIGSAILFYIVKGRDESTFDTPLKGHIIRTLLNGMSSYQSDETMMRNGLLTLCQFSIPNDVLFEYERLVKVLLYVVSNSVQEGLVQRIAIHLLNSLACQVDHRNKLFLGDLDAIAIMLALISDRLTRKVVGDVMESAWSILWNATDETPKNCKRFLDGRGIESFLGCLNCFPEKEELLRNMVGLLGNIAEVKTLRHRLMTSELIQVFTDLLESSSDGIEVSYNAAGVLAHIASDGVEAWDIENPSRRDVLEKMVNAIERWNVNAERNINYRSFEPILRLVRCYDTPECQHWAVWALANLTKVYPHKYSRLVEEEHGLDLLLELLDNPLPYARIKELSQMVLDHIVIVKKD